MFSEDYKRGVCLDDLDVGLDWNALISTQLLIWSSAFAKIADVVVVAVAKLATEAEGPIFLKKLNRSGNKGTFNFFGNST